MLLFQVLIYLFLINNAFARAGRQLLGDTDHNAYEYDVTFNIYYIWNKTTDTIAYNVIYSHITSIIEQTDSKLESIKDNSVNKDDLQYANKSQSLNIELTITTKQEKLEVYKNSFATNTKEIINSVTNTIQIRNVIVSFHLHEKRSQNHSLLIIGITIPVFLFLCCLWWISRQQKNGKLKKVRTAFGVAREEFIYNNGAKVKGINNYKSDPVDGKYWGHRGAKDKNMIQHTMLNLDLQFCINDDDDDNNNAAVTGKGSDCNGTYDIEGIYSNDSKRMALDQIYENGNIIKVRLKWNVNQNQFKGTWYTKKDKYSNEGFGYWVISICDEMMSICDETGTGNTPSDGDIATTANTTTTTIVYDNNRKGVMLSAHSFSPTCSPQQSFESAPSGTEPKKHKSVQSVCGIYQSPIPLTIQIPK